MPRTETPSWERVDELLARARAAKGGRQEVRSEQRRAELGIAAAREELRAFYGTEADDPRRERALRKALEDAREAAGPEEMWEAKLAAAADRSAAAERELAAYLREHHDDLAATLVVSAVEARDRLLGAAEELREAMREWGGVRGRFVWLIEQTGRLSAADLPHGPFGAVSTELDRALAPFASGVARDPRRFIPAPMSLIPEDEERAA